MTDDQQASGLRQNVLGAGAHLSRRVTGVALGAMDRLRQLDPRSGPPAAERPEVVPPERPEVVPPAPPESAALIEQATRDPWSQPSLAVLQAAGARVFAHPSASWDPMLLEAMALASVDPEMRGIALAQVTPRLDNVRTVVERARKEGSVDPAVTDAAVAHLSLVLSAGIALLDAAVPRLPSPAEWDTILARIGVALAPAEMLLNTPTLATRRWRVRVDVPDRPGSSARLFRALATLHANSVYLQSLYSDGSNRTIDVGLIAPESVSREHVLAAVGTAGANAHITAGGPEDAIDLLTNALDAATSLVKHPGSAPEIAGLLVAADRVEVVDAATGANDAADVLRLQWTPTRHVLLHREWAPFSQTEQARASALLRLAAAVGSLSGDRDSNGWIVPIKGGGTAWIRLARPEDAGKVAEMHERISEQSRYQRYFAHVEWRDIQLRRLSGGHRGGTLVAMSRDGDIVALGNVFPRSVEAASDAEIALLVEDALQGRGLGRAMLERMLVLAELLGFTHVAADVLADNEGMLHLLHGTGLPWVSTTDSGVRTLRAALPAPVPPAEAPPGLIPA